MDWPKEKDSGNKSTPHVVLKEICAILGIDKSMICGEESFLQLGGDSWTAIALSTACQNHGFELTLEDILRCDSISNLVECARALDPELASFSAASEYNAWSHVKLESAQPGGQKAASASVYSRPHASTCSLETTDTDALTEMQLSLVRGSQFVPDTNIIKLSTTYLTKDLAAVKIAWAKVFAMEQIFATMIRLEGGEIHIMTRDPTPFIWREEIVSTEEEYRSRLEQIQSNICYDTLFDVTTFKQRAPKPIYSTVTWNIHHALIDGFSASLVYQKVQQVLEGHQVHPGTPFAKVAKGLKKIQATAEPYKRYWGRTSAKFRCAVGELRMVGSSSPNPRPGNCSHEICFPLPHSEVSKLCFDLNISIACVYYAGWALVLSRYVDSKDVVFGIVFSGRSLPVEGAENTIGPLINNLPLHISIDEALHPAKYLAYVFDRMLELASVQFSIPEQGYSRNYSSVLAMEVPMKTSEPSAVQPVSSPHFRMSSTYPLSIIVAKDSEFRINYRQNEFAPAYINRIASHYQNAVLALTRDHDTVRTCLDHILSAGCRDEVLLMGNASPHASLPPCPDQDTLASLFEQISCQHPHLIAVVKESQELTYEELNKKADILSQRIVEHAGPGDVVCVLADRSFDWIISIYGVLKLGLVYCPLDPGLSPELRDAIIQDSGSPLYICNKTFVTKFKSSHSGATLTEDDLVECLDPDTSPVRQSLNQYRPVSHSPAYICYTSGSTGKPKGVICTHESLVAFQKDPTVRLFAEPGRRISQLMSPAFDGSIHEIFSTLSYGATLVLPDSSNPFAHLSKVDSVVLTPSIARLLTPSDYPQLRNVYLVGEAVPQSVNDVWAREKRLYNMYGPTEATCGATIKKLLPGLPVDIGRPNPSSRIYILDSHQRLVPPGVCGEIFIAGIQVAQGYVNNTKDTASKFLTDHIHGGYQERMYRTGDRGFWNASGCITYLGRVDRQIKLRGFRLELGDLEIRIARVFPAAVRTVVVVKSDYLVAMMQPRTVDVSKAKEKVLQVLPPHAVPKYFVTLDEFPVTKAGKLDYKKLETDFEPEIGQDGLLLKTPTERSIADTWREILHIDKSVPIYAHSSFMDLGGHSLEQMHLSAQLTIVFGRPIPLTSVLQFDKLWQLAADIDRITVPETWPDNNKLANSLSTRSCLSFMEREWVKKYDTGQDSSAFNVCYVCALSAETVDREKLIQAWQSVISRHRVLHSQYIIPQVSKIPIRVYGNIFLSVQHVEDIDMQKEINRPFQIDREVPVRVLISKSHMLLNASHLVCDLTTLKILLGEATSFYRSEHLPNTPTEYLDASTWKLTASPDDLLFWSTYLSNLPISLVRGKSLPKRRSYGGESVACRLRKDILPLLDSFCVDYRFTCHQVALAAVALALQADFENFDLILGMPYRNRQPDELETVGLFLQPLPVRISLKNDTRSTALTEAFVRTVQKSSQSALAHVIPWSQLLGYLDVKDDFPNHPLFDIMVSFHDDRHNRTLLEPLPGLEPLVTWTQGAKFALMCEFCALSKDCLLLRLEFDTDCFARAEVWKIVELVTEAMESLVTAQSMMEVQARLKDVAARPIQSRDNDSEWLFGRTLKEL